jgi:hypothetical protein
MLLLLRKSAADHSFLNHIIVLCSANSSASSIYKKSENKNSEYSLLVG